jgi:hypothetical protein
LAAKSEKVLRLRFHGRIIDHLGIQMYQSPVAAIAELVSNAWDADAENVAIRLPDALRDQAVITIEDNGIGMTFAECEDRFLNVGWCRRGDDPGQVSPAKRRPILGRKGIGKFAGFGIAGVIQVSTVSQENGEKTVFALDLASLRSGDYVDISGREINVLEHLENDPDRRAQHGTRITLEDLKLSRTPSPKSFAQSMARRFLLQQRVADFAVTVNGESLPDAVDLEKVQFRFPQDYTSDESPAGLTIAQDGWGEETLPNGRSIRWRIYFYQEPIGEEDLCGVAVFSRNKLAQVPFFFNLAGGLSGQHGQEYLSGQVAADYIDLLSEDIIATERQRINWEHAEARLLEQWGQTRIKDLLQLWRDRRGEQRRREIEEKIEGFSTRLATLEKHEQQTLRSALTKLASIVTLSKSQFAELAVALLNAWDQGRLRALIAELAAQSDPSPDSFMQLLVEADVLVALNVAEAVKTKLEAVEGLRKMVEAKRLENAVRDYIAPKPYLLDPKWETFAVEKGLKGLLQEAAQEARLHGEVYRGRVDLALRSGEHLLVIEFMRPGLTLDWDHLNRIELYVRTIRTRLKVETARSITRVTGLIVADGLTERSEVLDKIQSLRADEMLAHTWRSLLEQAENTWRDFLDIVSARAPDDERIQSLKS